jgi:hypothetical protein
VHVESGVFNSLCGCSPTELLEALDECDTLSTLRGDSTRDVLEQKQPAEPLERRPIGSPRLAGASQGVLE